MSSPGGNSAPPTPTAMDTDLMSPTTPAATRTPTAAYTDMTSMASASQLPTRRTSILEAKSLELTEEALLDFGYQTFQHLQFTDGQSTQHRIQISAPPAQSKSKIHLVTKPASSRQRPSLPQLLTRLRYPLAPLHPLPSGPPHPAFPTTLLGYHLLSEAQLDGMATYYHQRAGPHSPSRFWTEGYPANMNWNDEFLAWVGQEKGDDERIRRKKRKVGKFIGLRDCHTPLEECDEQERFERRRRERMLKGDEMAFFGRRGWTT